MTTIPSDLGKLRQDFRGELIRATDEEYETARRVWNGMIDRRPALIARCLDANDVAVAIAHARENSLPLAIRGGGHNVAGSATCDGGVVIDFARMKYVGIDPGKRTARVQPGVVWGEFDREAQAHGLTTTGGLVSSTGVAGLTLGGGIGWLMRAHGLTCDNLMGAEVVTAAGELVHANEHENPELLWGLRGGGGNFGVVTAFEFRLHETGPLVDGGLVMHPLDRAAELLRFYRQWTRTLPDSVTTMLAFLTAPPLPFVPQDLVGKPVVAAVVCGIARDAESRAAIAELQGFGPPAVDVIGEMPYLALQTMFDPSAPAGLRNYWKSSYLDELSDGAIEVFVAAAGKTRSPFSAIHVHQMGGVVARVPAEATAFANRSAAFVTNIIATWESPEHDGENMAWAREHFARLEPHARGAYVNFLGEEGDARTRAAYGEATYRRLAALKRRYDPENLFRLNQNIVPAG
jgi:FAD/FMN-containing dehydrogenase